MKRNIVIAALTAAALIGGGTATALATTADDEAPARQTDTRAADDDAHDDDAGDRDDDTARASTAEVAAPEAIASALRHTTGTVVSAELDDEDDDHGHRTVWEVDVLTSDNVWRSVTVDAGTGKVLDTHTEDEDDGTAPVRAALKGASVSAADAAKAVAGKGGEVTSVDLDEDGRSKGWEVETHGSGQDDEHDWHVDLRTGKATAERDDD
ncbi:PepSY domain-containing protein [Streptomyces sp. NPDC006134]|uniref:PepSY domain-containing protein n=1 Tax=Streptomyces sp. NPDC006134 TaxID=3154467 RepID=UPI0033DB0EF3